MHCCADYESWLQFQNCLYKVVRDPLFELAITLCIVLNTAFLAMEHHGMSESFRNALDVGNKVRGRSFSFKFLNYNPFLSSGFYVHLHLRMHCQTDGSIEGVLSVRLEHIRSIDSYRQPAGYNIRAGRRSQCVAGPASGRD